MSFATNSKGGEYNHKLTAKELPYHEHALYYSWSTVSEQSEWHWNVPMQGSNKYEAGTWPNNWAWNGTPVTCGNESHNNISPYITVFFWKRVN